MVPVRVREEQRQVERLALKFLAGLNAGGANAGARNENDDLASGANLNKGIIAAIKRRGRSGRGNGAAHAPEFYAEFTGRDEFGEFRAAGFAAGFGVSPQRL